MSARAVLPATVAVSAGRARERIGPTGPADRESAALITLPVLLRPAALRAPRD